MTSHAIERAADRFPHLDLSPQDIEDEVRAAFAADRVSRDKPPLVGGEADAHSLYAWTADGLRSYVIRTSDYAFTVVTTLSAPPAFVKAYCAGALRTWDHVGGGSFRCRHCGTKRRWTW